MSEALRKARKTRNGLIELALDVLSLEERPKLNTDLSQLDCNEFEMQCFFRSLEIEYHIRFEERILNTFHKIKDVFNYLINPYRYLRYLSRKETFNSRL